MSIFSSTKGLIKSNLKTYFKLRDRGAPHENALKLMIGTRYHFERDSEIRDFLWGKANELFEESAKYYAELVDVGRADEGGYIHKWAVIEIIKIMYIFENKMLSGHEKLVEFNLHDVDPVVYMHVTNEVESVLTEKFRKEAEKYF